MAQKPRRRRRSSGARKTGGVMMGMRSGFKKATRSVVGTGEQVPKRSSRRSNVITVLLLIAALAFVLYRWA